MTLPVTTLDPLTSTAHIHQLNENVNALASAGLFSARKTRSVGLRFTIHGGVWRSAAGIVFVVPEQFVDLTPSATNYLYADSSGVLHKVTVSPASWPGPIAEGTALYTLVVGPDLVTSGSCHLVNRKAAQGPAGSPGPTGPAGMPWWRQRKRMIQITGGSFPMTSGGSPGFGDTSGTNDWTVMNPPGATTNPANTSFYEGVLRYFWGNGARSLRDVFLGMRGCELNVRWGADPSRTSADHVVYAGLYASANGVPAANPSTFLNIVGIGCDSTDTNLQAMANNGSGTASKIDLGSAFKAKQNSPGRIYDATLTWLPGDSQVAYRVRNAEAGTEVNGFITTKLPALTQTLGWMYWTSGTPSGAYMCQIMGNTRF